MKVIGSELFFAGAGLGFAMFFPGFKAVTPFTAQRFSTDFKASAMGVSPGKWVVRCRTDER
jgi:hypothetical protein